MPARKPSQVNLGEESHGDQVLSCRSFCGAFSAVVSFGSKLHRYPLSRDVGFRFTPGILC